MILQQRIAKIEASLQSLEETSKPVESDQSLGQLTRMDAIQIQNMQDANLSTAWQNIFKLQEGLRQIDSGTFGLCQ